MFRYVDGVITPRVMIEPSGVRLAVFSLAVAPDGEVYSGLGCGIIYVRSFLFDAYSSLD